MQASRLSIIFFIHLLLNFYTLTLLLRILLPWVQPGTNTITNFIYKVTNPPLFLLHKFLPTKRRVDYAAITLLVILESIKQWSTLLLATSAKTHFIGIIILGLAGSIDLLFFTLFFLVLIFIFYHFFAPKSKDALKSFSWQFSEALLKRLQRFFPKIRDVYGLLICLILLKIITLLTTEPLLRSGYHLAITSQG